MERRAVARPGIEFRDEVERLTAWAKENAATDYRLESLGPNDAEGTEHLVWYEGSTVRKISFSAGGFSDQGPYGQTVEAFYDEELDGSTVLVMENRKASPAEYLERLFLQNLLFNIDNHLVAFHPGGFDPTQPLFKGGKVERDELDEFLSAFGFENINKLTWYSPSLEIAISDVSLHNVIKTGLHIFPFDIWMRRIRVS